MALGTPVAAAAAYSAASGTTVSPAYPAGILATDVVLLFVGQKPTTTTGGTVTTPTNWTLREELTGAGGYTAQGADTGNTNIRIYSWNSVVAGQTGNLTVTIGGNDVTWAFMVRIPKGAGAAEFGSADGQRTTTPTSPMSIALTNGATATNFQTGDRAIWAMVIPTDVTTPSQFSAQSVTATGATFGTATELNEPDSTTGNDIGGYSAWAAVTAGSSTTAPTVTVTLAGTLTNVRGPVGLIRVREAALAPVTGTMAATETGDDTFAATGEVLVQGSLDATEVGEDTFAATGTVSDSAITGSMTATETGSDTFVSTGDVIVQGTLAATETGSDTFASTGTVLVRGSLAATETGQDVFLASGGPLVVGNMAATETGTDTFASTGTVLVQGALAATEAGSDTFAATGKVLVAGTLAATEVGQDVFAATGTVVLGPVTGVMSATETGTDIFAATGTVLIRGSFAATEEGQDSFAATGTITVQGSLAAVEVGQDVFQATGFTGSGIVGSMSATDQPDGFGELYVDASYVEAGYVVSGVFGVVSGAAWVIVPLPAEPAWSPPASVVAPVWTSSAPVPEPNWAQPPSPPEPPWSGGAASTPPAWQSL